MPSYAKDPKGSHGVIVMHVGYVFYQYGHDGEFQGSEPLHGAQRQTRKKAVNKILDRFARLGVDSHECIEA